MREIKERPAGPIAKGNSVPEHSPSMIPPPVHSYRTVRYEYMYRYRTRSVLNSHTGMRLDDLLLRSVACEPTVHPGIRTRFWVCLTESEAQVAGKIDNRKLDSRSRDRRKDQMRAKPGGYTRQGREYWSCKNGAAETRVREGGNRKTTP